MDKICVKPIESVNGVSFGTKRDKVREIFGESKEFKKTIFSKNTSDDFGFCHIYYNVQDEFEAIEIFSGIVEIEGETVFPDGIYNLKRIISDLKKEDNGYISINSSIGVSMFDDKMESILFGQKKYYE